MVNITKNQLICISEKQNPIVFNLESREILFEFHFNYILEKIQNIQRNLINKLFFIKGIDS